MDATAILLANLAEIYDQLRKLRDTAGLTEDETRAVDEMLAEIDEIPGDRLVNIDDIEYLASAASRLKLTLETRAARTHTDGPSLQARRTGIGRLPWTGPAGAGPGPRKKAGQTRSSSGPELRASGGVSPVQHAVYSARLGRGGFSETARAYRARGRASLPQTGNTIPSLR